MGSLICLFGLLLIQTLAWVTKCTGYSAGTVHNVVKKVRGPTCPVGSVGPVCTMNCLPANLLVPPNRIDRCCADAGCWQVLSQRRIQRQTAKPLTHMEFVPHLARIEPVFKEEYEKFSVGCHSALGALVCDRFCTVRNQTLCPGPAF